MNKKQELISKINLLGGFKTESQFGPLVTLEDFFHGNDDDYSIAANLEEHPGINYFFETLLNLRNHSKVQDIYVEISDTDETSWPYSERVIVYTSIDIEELQELIISLKPDEIDEFDEEENDNLIKVKDENKIIGIWWD